MKNASFGRCLSVLGLAWVFVALTPMGAIASGPKRVLVLYSFGRSTSPFGEVGSAFQTELAEQFKEPIEFHEASLELPRFVAGESEQAVVAYLRALFAGQEPDLVVPCGGPAARFALRQQAGLFPQTPLLLAGVEKCHLQGSSISSNATAVSASFDLAGIVEHALKLRPGTTNVAIVLGSSSLETFWKSQMQGDFAPLTNHVRFSWLDQLTLPQMQERVAHLPANSVIFYFSMFTDAAGVPYQRSRSLQALHEAANAPMFGLFASDLGLGIVGGPLVNPQEQARETARAAIRILNGEKPATISTSPVSAGKPVYDWRELQRWGIRETQLPVGSEVRFVTPNFVKRYRRQLAVLAGFCFLESLLIVALLRQLRRRREAEKSLRESEERMTLAASAAELGIWEWDIVRNQIWARGLTAAGIALNGSSRADFKDLMQWVHPEDRERVRIGVEKSMSVDGHYESVHRTVSEKGQTRWMSARGRVEFDAGHKPIRMRGIWMDITTRKEAEELAQESERRFLLMANSAPVLIWGAAPDKRCNFFNQPWLEFTGRTLEQELADGWAEGVHPEDKDRCLKVYLESFEARLPFTMEYRLRRRDGEHRWISDHGVPRYDAQGNFLGYIGSCVDVTERRQAEAEAQKSRNELAHLTRVSTMGELAGSLAHEINQPLSAILSNAQAAQRFLNASPADLAEVKEILKDIADEDRRAAEVIVRLRGMLKKGEARAEPQDMNDVIREVLGMMRNDLVVRNVCAASRLADGLPRVKADRIQLQQVLVNLILNACEAMSNSGPSDRRLTISTELLDSGLVQVAVTDVGPGFASEVLNRIFEPFCTTKPDGLGMGLPICRSIIVAHGGRLWAANNNSTGATVRFTLSGMKEVA